ELRDRNWGIDVVEGFYRSIAFSDQIDGSIAIGKIRTNYGNITIRQLTLHELQNLAPAFIDNQLTICRPWKVAVRSVPFYVFFKESVGVSPVMKGFTKRAEGCGMAIAPRGSNRQSEDNDLHL